MMKRWYEGQCNQCDIQRQGEVITTNEGYEFWCRKCSYDEKLYDKRKICIVCKDDPAQHSSCCARSFVIHELRIPASHTKDRKEYNQLIASMCDRCMEKGIFGDEKPINFRSHLGSIMYFESMIRDD